MCSSNSSVNLAFKSVEDILSLTMMVHEKIEAKEVERIEKILENYGFKIYDLKSAEANMAAISRNIFDVIYETAETSWMTIIFFGKDIWACETINLFEEINDSEMRNVKKNEIVKCRFCGKKFKTEGWNPLRQHLLRKECILLCFN